MLITSESVEHIHRVVLHKCYVPELIGSSEESLLEKYVDLPGWKCYDSEYPTDLKTYCSHSTIAILGKGYDGFKYPDHVGVEIGDITASSYYRLEIHYQNPDGLYSEFFFLSNTSNIQYKYNVDIYLCNVRESTAFIVHYVPILHV